MAKEKSPMELLEILKRLKAGHSIKQINRDIGVHRDVIRKIKRLAREYAWFCQDAALPSLHELKVAYYGTTEEKPHPLDAHLDFLKNYVEANTPVEAIRRDLITLHGYTGSESQLRRYLRRKFPKSKKVIVLRVKKKGIMEVDFTNAGIVYDPRENRNRRAYIFSARFRFSRHAYRELVFSQKQEVFWRCHISAFEYFGGVPVEVVPDNLKAAVIKASFCDPLVNRGYQELAVHYDFLINPNQPRKPEHKGGVENDMKYVTGNFLSAFKVRQQQMGNAVPNADDLRREMKEWNQTVAMPRIIRETECSVKEMFEEEKEVLKSLPAARWDLVTWVPYTVRKTSRVRFDNCTYSVPDRYIGQKVIIAGDLRSVRVFLDYELIAIHKKSESPFQDIVRPEHLTDRERAYREYDRQRLIEKSAKIGPHTEQLVAALFKYRKHTSVMGSVKGILKLSQKYTAERLEKACTRALYYDEPAYNTVKRILKNNLDLLPLPNPIDSGGTQHYIFARNLKVYKNLN
jgi:transposase